MKNVPTGKKMRWLKTGPVREDGADSVMDRWFEQRKLSVEDKSVLIGQWYYYLSVRSKTIELHRTQQKAGQPTLTEVVQTEHCAISDDDLEGAVNYWSGGTFEPGCYSISPLIERKLRILFE